MPGLLDMFNSSPQQQGLLSAAAHLLEQSGPSLVPRGTLQILGGAVNAYNNSFDNALSRQYTTQMRSLQLKDAQSDLENQEMQRQRQKRIEEKLKGLGGGLSGGLASAMPGADGSPVGLLGAAMAGGNSGSSSPSRTMPSGIGIGLMNPDGITPASHMDGGEIFQAAAQAGLPTDYGTLNQLIARINRGQAPREAAAAMAGGEDPTKLQGANQGLLGGRNHPKAPAPTNRAEAYVNRLLDEAEVYSSEGDFDGADKRYKTALQFMPEVERIETALQGNQPVRVITFKDGSEKVSGFGAKPDMVDIDLGGTRQFVDRNRLTNGQSFAKTMTFADRNSAARLKFDREQAGADGLGPLTQDAIDAAAARYNFDGSLPPMGMGKQAAAGRSLILNRAAELKAGIDPEQQRREQLNNKGDVAARNSAVRSFATGRDGQAVQSANTALNHLDTIQQLAQAQKNGDVRAFNQAARLLGAAFGQAAPTNLNAALIMVAPEISKAVIGAGGTGHERDQALQALNPNGSPDQIIGATQTMQELFGGRLTEAKRTYERTTKLTDFDTAMLSPAARAVLVRAQQHAPDSTPPAPGAGNKTATLADIVETARRSRRSTKEVTAALRAKGYTIVGGQ